MAIPNSGESAPMRLFHMLKNFLQSLFIYLYGRYYNDYMSDRAPVLKPIKERPGVNEALLVILPGAFTKPEAYLALAHTIQEASKLRLWVCIINFTRDIPNSLEIRQRYDKLLGRVKKMGFGAGGPDSTKVYFAGHSLGVLQGRSPALHLADGFIQMAGFFDQKYDNLAQYPKPVLTLGGELDGQIPPTVMARHAGEVFAVEAQLGRANTVAQKPVVVVEGMNHCQFSHGVPNRKRGDFDPEVPIEQARREVAEVVAAFLELQVAGREAGPEGRQAWAALEATVSKTERDYRAFWEACLQETHGCSHYQVELLEAAGVALKKEVNVEAVWHDFHDNFVFSKPAITREEGKKIYMQVHRKRQGKYQLTSTLWIKMKSAEAVAAAGLGDVSERKTENKPRPSEAEVASTYGASYERAAAAASSGHSSGPVKESAPRSAFRHLFNNVTLGLGAQWNEANFKQALSLVPETARRRFERRGKKPRFGMDKPHFKPPEWVASEVQFDDKGGGVVEIVSPILITPVDFKPRFAGMHYVKIWSVARAMEWIMVDSLT
eukprot:jgi/Mesen1/8657/ME000504S08096